MRDQQPGSDLGNLSVAAIGYGRYINSNPSGSSTTNSAVQHRARRGLPQTLAVSR
jgi:hypothetical protein